MLIFFIAELYAQEFGDGELENEEEEDYIPTEEKSSMLPSVASTMTSLKGNLRIWFFIHSIEE